MKPVARKTIGAISLAAVAAGAVAATTVDFTGLAHQWQHSDLTWVGYLKNLMDSSVPDEGSFTAVWAGIALIVVAGRRRTQPLS